MEFLAQLTGGLFPETRPPENGWSGNTNAWDGVEYFRTLINTISALPSDAASNALIRLESNTLLVSYLPQVRHALAEQMQRRRDTEYDRPDWTHTIATLEDGAPAAVADLHALLVAHLSDLKERIERDNTDIYRQFWNLDSYARPVEPRPEEACRDDLVMMMRPLLSPKGVITEPEAHMARDKRADISTKKTGLHDVADRGAGALAIETLDVVEPETIAAIWHHLAARRFDVVFVVPGVGRPEEAIAMVTTEVSNRVIVTDAFRAHACDRGAG